MMAGRRMETEGQYERFSELIVGVGYCQRIRFGSGGRGQFGEGQ